MPPTETLRAAVRNNAEWCAWFCLAHNVSSAFTTAAWYCTARAPRYYPDAITLRPNAKPADVLSHIDPAPGCGIKDSFATLDLTAHGFAPLFDANWIHRPAGRRAAALRTECSAPDPAVRELTCYRGDDVAGTAILNLAAGVVGLSNVVAADDAEAVWSSAIAAAEQHWPGRPLVGYERDLGIALACGFSAIGPLRVWLRGLPQTVPSCTG